MIDLAILLVVGLAGLMLAWKGLEALAEFAGNAWRKISPQEKARARLAQEYLRSHPNAIRAPWRDWNDN